MFDFCDRDWVFIFRSDIISMIVSNGKIVREMGGEDWWELLMMATSISMQRDQDPNFKMRDINWNPQLYSSWGKGEIYREPETEDGRTKVAYKKGKTLFIFIRNNSPTCLRPYKLIVAEAKNPDNCFIDIDAPIMSDILRIFVAFLTGNFCKK